MIFIYSLLASGTVLGLWAVAALAHGDRLFMAFSLLGLVLITLWCGIAFARRAPRATALVFVGTILSLSLEVAGHMAGPLPPGNLWVWLNVGFNLLLGPLYIDLATSFPVAQPNRRWLVWGAYGVALVVAIIGPMGFLGPVFNPLDPLATQGREIHFRGEAHTMYGQGAIILCGLLQVIGLWLFGNARRYAPPEEAERVHRQAWIMILASVISWVPLIAFVRGVLPPGLELILHGPPALWFALLPIGGAIAVRHPAFYDHGGYFRRLLIVLGLASGAYLLYLLLVHSFTMVLDQVDPGYGHESAVFGSALLVALLVWPMRGWMAERVDRLFFPHLLGFRTLLQEASQALATTIIPADVAKLATEALPARLGVSGASLLVLDEPGHSLISLAGDERSITEEDPIWDQAYNAHGPALVRNPVLCQQLGLGAPVLMLPLRVGGRLVGLYLLGARQLEVNYTTYELDQLKILAHHLAIAVENGRALQKIDALRQRAVAEVEERNRIAREIHDTIAQGLTAASLQLDVVEATLTANPVKAARAAERAQAIVRANLVEARRSVLELRAPLLGAESLPGSLSRLVNQAAVDLGASGSFQIEGTYRGLPARIENQLFRIAQEALHNAVKYSRADQLTLILRIEEEQVVLSVSDDGAGFDPKGVDRLADRGHFGLAGMGERVRLLGGQLRIESEPGEGTLVEAIVPLESGEGESD